MAVSSSKHFSQRFAQFSKTYARHRPLIQRCLNVALIFYALGSTYRGLSSKPPSSSASKKRADSDKVEGDVGAQGNRPPRPPRVAVSDFGYLWLITSTAHCVFYNQVDAVFYQRLSMILRIVIPSIRSKEALLLVMHSSLLVFRTAISLYVAALDGKYVAFIYLSELRLLVNYRIVASLVRAQPLQFFYNILRWLLVAIPATWTNSWLSYIQNKLAIAYRTRLTNEVMKQYLGEETDDPDGKVYYKLCEPHLPSHPPVH